MLVGPQMEVENRIRCTAAKLAVLLVNQITISPGDRFPVGWHPVTGERQYETASEDLLAEAHRICSDLDQ